MKTVLVPFFFVILSLVSPNDCIAQDRKLIDSLKLVVQQAPSDTIRIKAYKDLSWAYATTRKKLDTATMYADTIYSLSNQINYGEGVALSHFYYGVINRFKGNYYQGIDHIEKYVSYYQHKGDSSRMASGLFQFAVMQGHLGDYKKSLDAQYRIYNIHKSDNYTKGMAFTVQSIGHIQRKMDKHQEAIASYEASVSLNTRINDLSGTWQSLMSLGNTYAEINNFNQAEAYLVEAMVYAKKADDLYGIAFINENLGNLNNKTDDHIKALQFHKKALEIRNTLPSKKDKALSQYHVGKTYLALGNTDKSKSYNTKSLMLAEEMNVKPLLLDNYKSMVDLYEFENNSSEAFKYLKLYTEIKDSLFNSEKNKQLVEIETKYQTAQKDQEIELLKKENEINEKEAQRLDIVKKAILISAILILLLAGMLIYILRQKLKNQKAINAKDEEIKISNFREQLGTLEMKALRAQMNPHFLFNCMNSINKMILSEDHDNASRYLTKFSKLIRLMLENSEHQDVSLQDELEMLKAYIELEIIRFKGKIKYSIHLDENLESESILIPSMILQPFVENAIWHGLLPKDEAGLIEIKIKENEDYLQCSITDSGIGRKASMELKKDSKHKKKSMGIKITSERLKLLTQEKIKEVISIIDLKDQNNNAIGTRVNILIPIS
ncbi:MAG: histidine kinase [Flavobacteriaceae bacterium]